MARKGVCTSPNGVMGCTSPTCPGGSFNANLKSLRHNLQVPNPDSITIQSRNTTASVMAWDLFDLSPQEATEVILKIEPEIVDLIMNSKTVRRQQDLQRALKEAEAANQIMNGSKRYSFDPFENTAYKKSFRKAFAKKFVADWNARYNEENKVVSYI